MRWSQRQVSLIWLPDRLHVALCHAAKPHHLRGHHWQHLPALAGEHFDSIFLFRRNVCVLLLLLTNTLTHLPFHRRNVERRQTACSTTPTCEFLARHQFQPTWWKPVCGVRNFSSRLRSYLMYTTAAIMSIGVLFDVLVVYYAKFVSNPKLYFFSILTQRPWHLPGGSGGGDQGRDDASGRFNHIVSCHLSSYLSTNPWMFC